MRVPSRVGPIIAAGVMLLAACGGGDDSSDVFGQPETTAEVTDPGSTPAGGETTNVETTPDETTSTPSSEPLPSEPTAPSTEPIPDIEPFCSTTEGFFISASALDFIEDDDSAATRVLLEQMQTSVPAAIAAAPTDDLASDAREAQRLLDIVIPALDSVDYDFDQLDTVENPIEVGDAFADLGELVNELETFLVDSCGRLLVDLQNDARAEARLVASIEVPATDGETDDPTDDPTDDIAGATREVTDVTGTISVTVPDDWTDVDGTPDGELRQLVAAPDSDAFLNAFDQPGVIVVSGDAPAGNGAEAGQAGLDGIATSAEADGCTQTASNAYDDGVYTGGELIYTCPGTTAVTRFAGGTNVDGSIFWLLGVIYPEGRLAIWTTVSESFLVD